MAPKRKASTSTPTRPTRSSTSASPQKLARSSVATSSTIPRTPKVTRTYGSSPSKRRRKRDNELLAAEAEEPAGLPSENESADELDTLPRLSTTRPPKSRSPSPSPAKRTRLALSHAQENISAHTSKHVSSIQDQLNASIPSKLPTTKATRVSAKRKDNPSVAEPYPLISTSEPVDLPTSPKKRRVASPVASSPPRLPEIPHTPAKKPLAPNPKSPTKPSPSKRKLTKGVPAHLIQCWKKQKAVIMHSVRDPGVIADADADEDSTNDVAMLQLTELFHGTVNRNEGNSCLLLGPVGSGKTHVLNNCISEITKSQPNNMPIIIRLSGWVQQNDRQALREIARQLFEQTGSSLLQNMQEDEDEEAGDDSELTLATNTYLSTLIAALPTLERPSIIILDAFELFALHPRQSLLYCLLDTVQAKSSSGKGLAVVGVTSRVDVINMLEKRVKSRFSGRTLRTSIKEDWWQLYVKTILTASIEGAEDSEGQLSEWTELWDEAVDRFVNERASKALFEETVAFNKNARTLARIMLSITVQLSEVSAFPTSDMLAQAIERQRSRLQFSYLQTMSYPCLCLLIASIHAYTNGYPHITYGMLRDLVRNQVRASAAAPVTVNGGSIGMMNIAPGVLANAFEGLVNNGVFVAATAPSNTLAKEFTRYRFVPTREEVKRAIMTTGHTQLSRWLTNAVEIK